MRHGVFALAISLILPLFLLASCSEDVIVGKRKQNDPPEVWLSSGPVEGDTTGYQIHFYWGGWDPDGEVKHFEFVVVDGDPFGFNAADTTGLDKWHKTTSYDSIIKVSADNFVRDTLMSNNLYSFYDKTHTFFVRAVDDKGARSAPAYRSFTAWTLAPSVFIKEPPNPQGGMQVLNIVITFRWEGRDPIDSPNNIQDPESVRYLITPIIDTTGRYDPTFPILADLNANPWRYEDKWSKWIYYRAPGDSGKQTIIGDDEILNRENESNFFFAVQAKDEAGAVTGIFDYKSNARIFIATLKHPLLIISEPYLGAFQFIGLQMTPASFDFAPGVDLNFSWKGDASSYAGKISGYSYGWDVRDINNPDDWEVYRNPYVKTAKPRAFYSGVHTFYVEAVDNSGVSTLGQVQINIIPFDMDRNLLWVDDYYSSDFPQISWAMPTETQHDEFWLDICSKVSGFDPERDVFDVAEHNYKAPEIALISRYKNIIWTYNASQDFTAWPSLIKFVPENLVTQGTSITLNYLPIFLNKGGHLLTLGNSKGTSGLAATIPVSIAFPVYLKCEINGNTEGCERDTFGVDCMPYKDYCVSVIDKVRGVFRTGADIPRRYLSQDALADAYLAEDDSMNLEYPGLPRQLHLWGEVTKPGRFYDPSVRGLDLVEVYNPEYWMERSFINPLPCFHPIYRMHSRSTVSPINNAAVALWITKYADVEPDVSAGIAVKAPSFHFGFPLWYFDRSEVDSLMNVIFSEWRILKE